MNNGSCVVVVSLGWIYRLHCPSSVGNVGRPGPPVLPRDPGRPGRQPRLVPEHDLRESIRRRRRWRRNGSASRHRRPSGWQPRQQRRGRDEGVRQAAAAAAASTCSASPACFSAVLSGPRATDRRGGRISDRWAGCVAAGLGSQPKSLLTCTCGERRSNF